MAGISATEFAKKIISIADQFGLEDLKVSIFEDLILKIRINLGEMYIDVFYNAESGKRAYALIKDNERIFGADNTGRWHKHPFANPDGHTFCKEVSFEDFLKETFEFLGKK